MFSAVFPVSNPFLTGGVFEAESAEFHSFFLYGAVMERAGCTHSEFAFAASAPALCFSVVGRTESTGEATDADLHMAEVHLLQPTESLLLSLSLILAFS